MQNVLFKAVAKIATLTFFTLIGLIPTLAFSQIERGTLEEGDQIWHWQGVLSATEQDSCGAAKDWMQANYRGSDFELGQVFASEELNGAEEVFKLSATCPISYIDPVEVPVFLTTTTHIYCIKQSEPLQMSVGVCDRKEENTCPVSESSSFSPSVGNPIFVGDGSKRQFDTDWVSPLDPRFGFERNYRSDVDINDLAARGFGFGWSSDWNTVVRLRGDNRRFVYLSGGGVHEFTGYRGTRPTSQDHSYVYDALVSSEQWRHVLTSANGRKDFFRSDGSYIARLHERRWPDGYAVFATHNANGGLASLQDNRGQRAEFHWVNDPTINNPVYDINIWKPDEPVVERIDVDTNYDGSTFQPDIAISYEYDYEHIRPGGAYLTPVWRNTRVLVTELSSGRVLTDTGYGYHGLDDGLLASISDGRQDANGLPFDYATFDYEIGSTIFGPASEPITKSLRRAVSTTHPGGAGLTQVGFPVQTATGAEVTVTGPLGKDTIYSFEEIAGQDRLVGVDGVSTVSCLPSNTTATYNEAGRIIERVEKNGARTAMTRDDKGRILTRTEDADGLHPRVTTYTWHWKWRRMTSRTTDELRENFTYDDGGLLTSYTQTDVLVGSPDLGKVRTWDYNYTTLASGLKVLTSLDGPGLAADGVNDVTTYTYNTRGQLQTTTDANGLTQEVLSYGVSGQPTLIRDHQGFEWALEYDLAGRMLKSTFEPGVLNEETTYSYDIIGQLLSSTDALGRTWNYSYDEARRLTQITAPSGEAITFDHDAMGNVTRTTYADVAAVTRYLEETQYDELGRILQAIGSNGQTTSFGHDVEDNLATITDATNLTTTKSYDALNRMTDIVDRASGTTLMTHDINNQMTSYTDPRGFETAFNFNGFGNLLSEVSADRGTMSYSYDNRGLPTSMTDGRGIVTNYAYDNGGRLVSKTYPSDATLNQSFVYHRSDNVPGTEVPLSPVSARSSSTYPNYGGAPELVFDGIVGGENYIHTYNGAHEFIEVDLGSQQTLAKIVVTNRDAQYGEGPRLNGAMVVGYDDARVEVYRSAPISGAGSGDVFSFQLGGMVNARYAAVEHSNQWLHISEIEVFGPDPTGPGGATPTNPYDIGMLATVTDQSGQTDYSNDALRGAFREDLRQIGSAQYSTTYSSDALGQTTQMDYPSGSQLLFSYDSDGDLTGLQWKAFDPVIGTHGPATDVVSGMTYKPMGPLASLSYGDGGTLTASYDTSYRLTGLTDTRAGTTLRDVSYSWTNRNNLGGVTDNLNPNQNELYDYSPREFLASGDGTWGELDWLYDSVGNRTQQMSTISGVSTTDTYSYPADSNRLTNIAFSTGGLRELTYDTAGNVTFDNRNGPGYGYNYDAAGRMSSFAINGVIQAEYEYNYLGQQVIRRLTQTGETIHSVHDALGNRIAEYHYDETTGTSTLIREYIWAAGVNVAVVENGALYYVRTDHIGRPVFATDSMGVKVWEASYLPFGGVQTSTGPNADLRFPGQWFQSETGLHQNWMRDYDPTTGRYIQADPLGLVDGASVYGYVLQNPGRYVDPRGQQSIPSTVPDWMAGGPYSADPNGRPGRFLGGKSPAGPRYSCQYVPRDAVGGRSHDPYWKHKTPGQKGWQRYNLNGDPITAEEAHPQSNGPGLPRLPTLFPWFFFEPALSMPCNSTCEQA